MKKEKYIYERNSSFTVVIKWTEGGKRKQKHIGSFNPKDYGGSRSAAFKAAKAARDQALVDAELSRISSQTWTVDRLFRESQERCSSLKTARNHEQMYNALIPEDLRFKEIQRVTLKEIQGTVDRFAETHSQDATDRVPLIWKLIYKHAILNEVYVPDRSQAIQIPKCKIPVKRRQKFARADQLEDFMEALLGYNADDPNAAETNLNLWVMIRIMQFCGLRPQEVLALECRHVDLEAEIIRIRQSVGSTKTATRQIITPKTEDSIRDVPIPAELVPVLEKHISRRGNGLLFPDPVDGLPYEIDWLSDYMLRVSKKAGTKITLYMLRHMFATDMSKVVSPRTVQALMGHESAVMSLRYTAAPDPEELAEAIRKRRFS